MLKYLVNASIQARGAVIAALVLLLAVGIWAARTLPIDALPDVSTVQVSVLTSASGLSPVEIERTVLDAETVARCLRDDCLAARAEGLPEL